jgi:hypothetical protein
MHYIFNTEQKAIDYEQSVCLLHNYTNGSHWDDVSKHASKDQWAVLCSSKLVLEDKEPQEKPSDWNTEI